MGLMELDGAPGEEPMGPLEQVGPIRQELTGPFGDQGAPGDNWGPFNKKRP